MKRSKITQSAASPQVDNFGRLQPQDLELERAILGALLVEQDAYYQVSDILKPTSFYEKRHQIIFEAIQSLVATQSPIDILTVNNQLEKKGQLEIIGGSYYLTELSQMVYSAAHIEYHARIIADKATARRLINITSEVQAKSFDPTQSTDDIIDDLETKIFELKHIGQKRDFVQINSVLDKTYDKVQDAAKCSSGMTGIASGFHELDKITAGWQRSDLVILAARPAMGKTAFSLSMAKNMAIDQRIPTAFFSLEMSNEQLVSRLVSNVCEISSEQLRTGKLNPAQWHQLDTNIRRLYDAPLYVDDTPALSIVDLRSKARRLVNEHGVKIIMIDYLQLMNAGVHVNSRQEEVSMISRALKCLAKDLDIPILALSQLNRGLENRSENDKRPQLSDLRESGAIEQDADIVTFIHRPEKYGLLVSPEGEDLRDKAEIIIAKHRNGALKTIKLKFIGKYVRFENINDYIPLPGEKNMPVSEKIENAPIDIPVPSSMPAYDFTDPLAPLASGTNIDYYL